jgi:homoserine acetyltransferase
MNNVFFNENNTDPAVITELLTRGNDMPSVGVLQQYLGLSQTGKLSEHRGGSGGPRLTYADGLSKIQCPCLIVGGSADQIAPPAAQQFLLERLGSADKTYLYLGRAGGFRADYGHNDSLIGRGARDEVYPLLARWLAGQPISAPPIRR